MSPCGATLDGVRKSRPLGIDRWPSGVTHIVEPHLSRSLKSLAGMAAGAWLVSTAFVGACQASCGLAEPVRNLAAPPVMFNVSWRAPLHDTSA